MWELTLLEKIKKWIDNKTITSAYKILKKDYGIDFWKYPTEELLIMYEKNKDQINLD